MSSSFPDQVSIMMDGFPDNIFRPFRDMVLRGGSLIKATSSLFYLNAALVRAYGALKGLNCDSRRARWAVNIMLSRVLGNMLFRTKAFTRCGLEAVMGFLTLQKRAKIELLEEECSALFRVRIEGCIILLSGLFRTKSTTSKNVYFPLNRFKSIGLVSIDSKQWPWFSKLAIKCQLTLELAKKYSTGWWSI